MSEISPALALPGHSEAVELEVPLVFKVVGAQGQRVVSAAFLATQMAEANRVFAPFRISFRYLADLDLDERYRALETKADRDDLATVLEPKVVNVFVVKSLRDVDDPRLFRMGVCWRKLSALHKKYVIVAASCRPSTTAHELGHFFGLGHTGVVDNLMSYAREDEAAVFLDVRQGQIVRGSAQAMSRRGELSAPR